jgi:hypothetical protein
MIQVVRWCALGFALLLGWVGSQALLFPDAAAATSQAPGYAWFHAVGAVVGLVAFTLERGRWSPVFLLAFGVADLYQAAASAWGWFPRDEFRWTKADDGLHLTLGAALVVLGALGARARRKG